MIKALGLLGSARKGGNTELLLQSVSAGIKSQGVNVELIRLSELKIAPCRNCGGCDETGVCVQQDDMQQIFDKLLSYDIILLASPIYFMGVSAWTKALIDRCQALWIRKYRLNKLPDKARSERKGIFLSVSGMKKPTVFEGAKLTVKSFFATIHVTYLGNLLFPGIDEKGEIAKHPTALNYARNIGEQLVREFKNPEFRISIEPSDMMVEHDRK